MWHAWVVWWMIFIFENNIVSVIFETWLAQMSNNNQNIVTGIILSHTNANCQTQKDEANRMMCDGTTNKCRR